MNDKEHEDFEEITDEETESKDTELEEVEELSNNKLKDLREKIARLDTEKKEILEVKAEDLKVNFEPRLITLKVISPKERGGNVTMLSDAKDLVKTLRDKEGLI